MARVSVFLKDELLDEINREAEAEETNRSSLIQSALEEYLRAKKRQREEEEKRRREEEEGRAGSRPRHHDAAAREPGAARASRHE